MNTLDQLGLDPGTLAWKFPWTEEPDRLLLVSKVTDQLLLPSGTFFLIILPKNLTLIPLYYINWFYVMYSVYLEKEMATHSSVIAWRIPWMEKPGRLQSMRSLRVGHD